MRGRPYSLLSCAMSEQPLHLRGSCQRLLPSVHSQNWVIKEMQELYQRIFHICLFERANADVRPPSPLALSQVCASWRTAALDSPLLWSTIYMTPFTRSELVKHHLVLSATCPLTLVISTTNDEPLMLALSQVGRWKEVSIVANSSFEADAVLAALTRPAPNLSLLTVQLLAEDEIQVGITGQLQHLRRAFPDSPKFSRLSFASHLLPHSSIFPEHITELSLVDSASLALSDVVLEGFGARVIDILERLPLLQAFSLQTRCPCIHYDFNPALGPHRLPPIPGLGTARRLVLSHLKRLTLTALPALCAVILIYLATPVLEELSIRNTSVDALRPTSSEEEYRRAFRNFLSQRYAAEGSPSDGNVENIPLRKLYIHNASLSSGTLIHLPHLQVLQLHDSDIEDATLDELRRSGSAKLQLEELDLRWEGRVSGSAIIRLLKDLGTCYSPLYAPEEQRGVKIVTLLHCSYVQEESIIEVAKLTTCRLIAEVGDYCYPEGCCKNQRYRQRMRLLYRNSSNYWSKRLIL